MTAPWPWPCDNVETMIRRIALLYRDELRKANEGACDVLDSNMRQWGQHWVTDDDIVDLEALVTKGELASRFGIRPWQVRDWSKRWPDRLPIRGMRANRNLYRLGDALACASRRQTR